MPDCHSLSSLEMLGVRVSIMKVITMKFNYFAQKAEVSYRFKIDVIQGRQKVFVDTLFKAPMIELPSLPELVKPARASGFEPARERAELRNGVALPDYPVSLSELSLRIRAHSGFQAYPSFRVQPSFPSSPELSSTLSSILRTFITNGKYLRYKNMNYPIRTRIAHSETLKEKSVTRSSDTPRWWNFTIDFRAPRSAGGFTSRLQINERKAFWRNK